MCVHRPVGRAVTRSSQEREIGGSKSRARQNEYNVVNGSPPLRHFFVRSCVARKRNDAEMVFANSLHALACGGRAIN